MLPNLPETHFVVWGGQAAGTVFAINPLLEGSAIAELIEASGASILVTLAPFPGLGLGLVETNGHQNYRNWETMRSYHPRAEAPFNVHCFADLATAVRYRDSL